MEEIRQELVEAGAIGRVVDDFNPHIIIYPFYVDRQMSSGDEVLLGDLRESPDYLGFSFDPDGPGLRESFTKPTLITMIMTDPDSPRGEYLHWMVTSFVTLGQYEGSLQEVVPYEAPRSIGTRTVVFTLFKPNESPNFVLNSRENFSTRGFAEANALGPPLGAAFLKIETENEDEDTHSDVTDDPSISCTAPTYSSQEKNDDEATSKRKRFKRI